MIREIALIRYPAEARLAVRWAARFLARIDVPLPKKLGHARFKEALRAAFLKLEDQVRHEEIPSDEAWALRIVVNFAIAQVSAAQEALARLRQELRAASRAAQKETRTRKVTAG